MKRHENMDFHVQFESSHWITVQSNGWESNAVWASAKISDIHTFEIFRSHVDPLSEGLVIAFHCYTMRSGRNQNQSTIAQR